MANFRRKIHIGTKQVVALTCTGILTLFFNACGFESLTELSQVKVASLKTNQVDVDFCTDPAYTPKQYLKMVVVLDHSGSNKQNFLLDQDGAPLVQNGNVVIGTQYGTDPNGTLRYGSVTTPGTLLHYLQNLPANDPMDPKYFFALVDFSNDASTYPVNETGFTSDIPAFFNYVQQDATSGGTAPNDVGSTNYLGALGSAVKLINSDIDSAKACAALPLGSASPGAWCPVPGTVVSSSYVVVFMSDGAPITNISGIGVDANGQAVVNGEIKIEMQSPIEILGQVSALTSLAQNTKFVSSVNLFTIYYYALNNIDNTAKSLMAAMAKAGNGIAYVANSGTNLNYMQFQPPIKKVKPVLSDVFVTNASVNWWNDGTLHQDSDLDGLPNDVESTFGSSSSNRASAGNGISDLVRYVVGSGSLSCGGIPSNRQSDPNGLTDCEKSILNNQAGIGNPDSNGDMIPDFLEFMAAIPFQAGTAPAVNQPTQDGFTLYQKIKYSLPVNVPAQQVLDLKPSTYRMQLLSSTPIQDCYHLTVNDLPQLGDNNTVRVDVLQKDPISNINKWYKVGHKAFAGSASQVSFKDWTDAGEITIPTPTWKVWP